MFLAIFPLSTLRLQSNFVLYSCYFLITCERIRGCPEGKEKEHPVRSTSQETLDSAIHAPLIWLKKARLAL